MPEPLKNPRIVFVIGTIAPYTHRLYEALGAALGGQLTVLCCAEIEPTRSWIIGPARNYRRIVLPGLRIHRSDLQNIYLNPFVLWHLFRLKPDITVIGSFSPTMLLTALWSIITGTRLAVSTDGVPSTDPGSRSFIHRLVRRLVIPRADIGIGASRESLDLLRHYGLPVTAATALSPVLPAWDFTGPSPAFSERRYDLFFCGRLDERKGIPFLIETLEHCVSRGYRPSLRVAGEGPLRPCWNRPWNGLALPPISMAICKPTSWLRPFQAPNSLSSPPILIPGGWWPMKRCNAARLFWHPPMPLPRGLWSCPMERAS